MSQKEVPRPGVLQAVCAGQITLAQAARALGLSRRHVRRLLRRYAGEGAAGLVHRSRGRPSPRRLAPALQAQIATLEAALYFDYNDYHLAQVLAAEHGLAVSREWLRRWRRHGGRAPQHVRRPGVPRHRRPRTAQSGALVLLDGSDHAWLQDRGPTACLQGMLDDATSRWTALVFRPDEDLHGYVSALAQTAQRYGLPLEEYGDRHGIFVRLDAHWTVAEQLAGHQTPTTYGQILAALGIGYIAAHSPQAKGRIERAWATLQDRFVKFLRRYGVEDYCTAQAYVPQFLAEYHAAFARPPADPTPAWRPAPRDLAVQLACRYSRRVARDHTVHIPGRLVQLRPPPGARSWAGRRVEVRELLDGRLLVFHEGLCLATQPAPPGPFTLVPRGSTGPARRRALQLDAPLAASGPSAPAPPSAAPGGPGARVPPPAAHPWRKPFTPTLAAAQRARRPPIPS